MSVERELRAVKTILELLKLAEPYDRLHSIFMAAKGVEKFLATGEAEKINPHGFD